MIMSNVDNIKRRLFLDIVGLTGLQYGSKEASLGAENYGEEVEEEVEVGESHGGGDEGDAEGGSEEEE